VRAPARHLGGRRAIAAHLRGDDREGLFAAFSID